MIKFELFALQCMSDKFSWKNKQITIKNNIKYILTSLEHYQFTEQKTIIPDDIIPDDIIPDNTIQELKLPFTYSDMSRYWFNNIDKYSNFKNTTYVKSKFLDPADKIYSLDFDLENQHSAYKK